MPTTRWARGCCSEASRPPTWPPSSASWTRCSTGSAAPLPPRRRAATSTPDRRHTGRDRSALQRVPANPELLGATLAPDLDEGEVESPAAGILEFALGLRTESLQLLRVDQRPQQPVQGSEVLQRLLQLGIARRQRPDLGPEVRLDAGAVEQLQLGRGGVG